MNQSKIAVRYAKALFVTATEHKQEDAVFNDMLLLSVALKEVVQLGLYLKSPVVKPSKKKEFLDAALNSQVSFLTLNFLQVLVDNKRETELEGVLRWFIHLYNEKKGIKSAIITTAVELSDESKKKLKKMLSDLYKTDVHLEAELDASIIGGFVLKVDDQQYDASVATGLKRVKSAILSEIKK